MKKNRILTNSLRVIKLSFPRFLSLTVISMLGVFCFAGLGATAPDMIKTLDNYLDSTNTYDIKILSTMGFTDNDISALKKIKGVNQIEGGYSKDVLIAEDDSEYVINVSSLPTDINKLKLIKGKLPSKDNEIVVEEVMLSRCNLKIGDTILLSDEVFINKEVKIVGTVDSSLYFNAIVSSSIRGNTSIGTGTINYYTFCLASNFNQDYYTNIYLTVTDALELETSKDDYNDLINQVTKRIENISNNQEKNRRDQIYNEVLDKITKEEDDGNKKFDEVAATLDSSKEDLDKARANLNTYKNKLAGTKTMLNQARASIDDAWGKYRATLSENNINEAEIDKNIEYLESEIVKINQLIEAGSSTDELKGQLTNLNTKLALLKQLKSVKSEILNNEAQYNSNLNQYNTSYNSYLSSLNLYNTNYDKYLESLDTYNTERADFNEKISEAKEELNKIDMPSWYIYDRTDYTTYAEYVDDTNSIKNLSGIFPIVFFAVSILVSLISMNRMVEDDRGEIGTLKSLGFSNKDIMIKYLLFSFLAMVIGGVLGSLLGVVIIPSLIFKIYKILFDIPNFYLGLNLNITIIGFLISFICVCGATVYTVSKVLKEKPSELMRPKAPKSGKRVCLEKISFIWDNISFSNKVTIRNLFRYKKRVIVTIVGIAGCCGLMLCGFGIKDSIMDIAGRQYGEIFKFDAMAYVNNISSDTEIFNNSMITSTVYTNNLKVTVSDTNVNLFIANDNEKLDKVVNLFNYKTKKRIKLVKGKVVITEKLASLKKLKVGDKINIVDVNNKKYQYEISDITANYFEHFIYMDKNTYEESGGVFDANVVYLNTKKLSNKDKDVLSEELLKNDEVLSVNYVSSLVEVITNMLNSLDEVVFILIVLAASLSFVVLYNLSNINIMERKREIATLKVLGFYNKEVDNYITKENIILTIIGILIGLGFGYLLTNIIITTVEIEKARFLKRICFNSYIYAAGMSFIFTLIVNIVTHFSLKKIDMIESLKSVE